VGVAVGELQAADRHIGLWFRKPRRGEMGRLELEFRGTTVTAFLSGNKLAEVESEAHARGMFGLGTEWDHIQFDNLRVEP
jgi:hypothetical protein